MDELNGAAIVLAELGRNLNDLDEDNVSAVRAVAIASFVFQIYAQAARSCGSGVLSQWARRLRQRVEHEESWDGVEFFANFESKFDGIVFVRNAFAHLDLDKKAVGVNLSSGILSHVHLTGKINGKPTAVNILVGDLIIITRAFIASALGVVLQQCFLRDGDEASLAELRSRVQNLRKGVASQ
ncbi:MAG: hypothetical protein VYD87_01195 [Pseudomonadota bacterium]|nr:hypothetical protein [Pseudomonadota bacterium]